jgi:hypothetical protein
MAIFTNSNIVTDGLVIYLDPSNPRSFLSPTNIVDISKNRTGDFTINGSPNIFTTGSISTIEIPINQTSKFLNKNPCIHPTGSFTITVGVIRYTSAESFPYSYADPVGGQNSVLIVSTPVNLQCLVANINVTYNQLTIPTSEFKILTVCRDVSNSLQKGFVDDKKQTINSVSQQTAIIGSNGSLVIGQEQDTIGGGFVAGQVLNGLFYFCLVYDRVLGDEEILQNFYALRGRGYK